MRFAFRGGGGHAVVTGWQWSRSPDKRPLDPWGLRIQIYLGDAFSDRFSVSGKLEYYVFSKIDRVGVILLTSAHDTVAVRAQL